jgi:hypothetical protein
MATVWNTINANMDITNGVFEARHSKDFWKATAANICVICLPIIICIAATEMIFKNGAIFLMNTGIVLANAGSALYYRAVQHLNPPQKKEEVAVPPPPYNPPTTQQMEQKEEKASSNSIPIARPIQQQTQHTLTIPIPTNVYSYWENYIASPISVIWQAPSFGFAWNWVTSLFVKGKED